jgi:hypothetical protein
MYVTRKELGRIQPTRRKKSNKIELIPKTFLAALSKTEYSQMRVVTLRSSFRKGTGYPDTYISKIKPVY